VVGWVRDACAGTGEVVYLCGRRCFVPLCAWEDVMGWTAEGWHQWDERWVTAEGTGRRADRRGGGYWILGD
jgi:hypothetical protein